MRVARGWQSTAGARGPEDCRRQQSETSYRPEAPLRQQLTRIPRGPADSNDGARHRATHSKALHPRAPPERHRAGPQGNRADRRFVWRSAWNALVLPYSVQCHPHRGGRRIYACVDKILLHTSARFDQSKAIRWRGWGRLASAFRELPWNFGPCFHTTFAKLANAFIRLGRSRRGGCGCQEIPPQEPDLIRGLIRAWTPQRPDLLQPTSDSGNVRFVGRTGSD